MGLRKISLLAVVWFALFVDSNAEEQESEHERRPIKTFKTIYGEIIDCTDIYKQPAFDHPLLKDHKLQKKPSFSLHATKHRQRAQVKQLERPHLLDGCPDGTIPILRTTEEDRMRAKLLEHYHSLSTKSPGFHFAFLELPSFSNRLRGAKAYIDNYIPKCEKGQFSAAQIWIINDLDNPSNMIQFGWRMDPGLYNDDRSHLFIYWKNADGPGCFDLRCQGFVQVDHSITLGQVLPRSSVYEGPQIEIHLAIRQDETTKDWWFIVEKDNTDINVGYWPARLLPELIAGAEVVQYGGVAYAAKDTPFPPMGSGYFPDKSYSHACYFRQIHFMNGSQVWQVPEFWRASAHTSSKDCYGAALDDVDKFMGYTLLLGGPGGDGCGV